LRIFLFEDILMRKKEREKNGEGKRAKGKTGEGENGRRGKREK
jgi:hypothetical protein